MEALVFGAVLALAFANGANDNMKGVATLCGSGALSYRGSLAVATGATLLGSLASLVVARGLVAAFSAKGIVPEALLTPGFIGAVAVAATATVLIASCVGLPISTTHAILGALGGAGLLAAGSRLALGRLAGAFALPLLASPLLAIAGVWLGLRVRRRAAPRRAGVVAGGSVDAGGEAVAADRRRRRAADGAHVASASLVSFARGLNDTPKMLGLLVGAGIGATLRSALAVGCLMALGGILAARPVLETLAERLTPMSPDEGLAGNLTTAVLVIGASRLGLPVSTTHVATGGIFGIGISGEGLHRGTTGGVVGAWIWTLPLAAVLAAIAYLAITHV